MPYCLFKENIWWISLAKASDDQTLGIRGAVISSTLEASDNTERFMNDGAIGPANAIEILAVPEFQQKHLFRLWIYPPCNWQEVLSLLLSFWKQVTVS